MSLRVRAGGPLLFKVKAETRKLVEIFYTNDKEEKEREGEETVQKGN